MGEHIIKMPDVGEGVAEAELVEWYVKVGDIVREDTVLAAVMTDKATVEIPSPIEGEVAWLAADVGASVSVGSPLARLKVGREDTEADDTAPMDDRQRGAPIAEGMAEEGERQPPPPTIEVTQTARPTPPRPGGPAPRARIPRAPGEKPLASPAVRLRAREAGIDLRQVPGSGPAGRILHEDLDTFLAAGTQIRPAAALARDTSVTEIKVVGLRRRIAEKMTLANARIPHITYVEEVDVTALEELRATMNGHMRGDRAKLTLLPFLMRAMVKAISEQPEMNALYDEEAGVVRRYGGVHIGIATQTSSGLMAPVVRHVEARDIWVCAAELSRLTEAARNGTAKREELTDSTITVTSLGAMGGVVTTPVINHPEVAIIGVNKIMVRPAWNGSAFIPRKMMNLSSSFDHRVIDGWDAARFIQRIKTLLETPALIFIDG
ncbi:dihydrolipoamide acetyltransferase family protein [Chelativorans salis]|uniref:Dihydrolipoamide acetyltransferase component of pyruvate dehydrogenase complex n=1 Tax=Chelativorans salis TaxID=2978478 RepID=A0ABT2LVG9_9HYPH|nr:dihydrolipoamide acetyltransferase family protein [Chelativorans sp. EGI FJ00035]MCT7378504.1 2-oxo acid dehydrogenase subunit E2 [Chelativorans sp. EGI FJ00035]